MRWTGIFAALFCLLSSAIVELQAASLPPGFSESVVFSGLTEPTTVRFSPDGKVFVAEKSGLIKVFPNLSTTTPTVFHDLRTNVHNYWDRGLMGLELHPDFPTVPYVYVSYTYDKDPNNAQVPRWGTVGGTSDACPTPPGPTTDGCVVSGRVSLLQSSGGNVSTGTEIVLVEGWGQQFPSHSMDTVMFGPDGALYASAGDGASFNFADYGQAGNPLNPLGDPPVGIGGVQTPPKAEGGATRSQSLRRVNGPVVLDGTIIRIDPYTGAPLSDNPLFANTDPNARRIVGYGFRNPFRFTFRPGTNELWVGDVGWGTWEEINRISDPLSPTVRNFGWPCYEGAGVQSAYQSIGLTICQNLYSQPSGHTPPHFAYQANQPVVSGETCSNGSSSISGLAFMQGGTYPAPYQGALFFADHSRRCIWSMRPGANGLPDPATRATFVDPASNPVDIQIGPGGDLFYVDFEGGAIRRIRYTSGNQAPTVVIQATPLAGPVPLNVTFNGSGSTDPDAGDTLKYSWDLNGDGIFDDATTAQTSFTYTQAKLYKVQLKVTDNHGASSVDSISIQAGSPTSFIDAPTAGTQWQVGQSISFSGHATAPGQGALPPSAFLWEVILHHCPSDCHTHPIQSFPGVTSGSFSAPDHEYLSYLEIKLTVKSATGLTDTKSVQLNPQTVTLNFESIPPGLQLAVGSSTSVTPFTRTVILGSMNSVSAGTPQIQGSTTYHFNSWSDGGNQSHLVLAAGTGTYTANYSLTADTSQPSTPTSLTASTPSGTQVNLSWPTSTDNIGVTGYQVERCQGAGCSSFALVASPTTTSYADTGLSSGATYNYRVRARDAVGNFSPYSPITTAQTAGIGRTTLFTDTFNRADSADLGAAYTDSYSGFTSGRILSGRVVMSAVGAAAATVEQYTGVTTPNDQWSEVTIGALTSGVGAQAGVHLRLSNPSTYSGYRCFAAINQTNRSGIRRFSGGVSTSLGSDTTTVWGAGDKLRCEVQGSTIKLYRVVGAAETLLLSATDATYASGTTGIYVAVGAGGAVTDAQLSGFAMGGFGLPVDTTPPTAPGSPTGSAASGTQINVSWPAASDLVGVTNYRVERCQGAGCSSFALIASPTTTSYADTGLTPGTSYSYRVRAEDAAHNLSPYSSPILTVATPATPPPGRTTLFTDTFNRADSADLGAAYTDSYSGFTSGRILSGRVVMSAVGAAAATVEQYTGVTTPNDQWSEVTIGALTSGVGAQAGVHLRLSNPSTYSGYRCFAAINQTNRSGIRRFSGGVSTSLGSDTTTVWGAGDKLRCEVQGSTIKLYRVVGAAETLLLSATDATYASGTTGIYVAVGAGGAVTDAQLSGFAMGGFGLPVDTTPPTAPGSPTGSAASGTQINVSWPAASDLVGVTNYRVERCQGAGCSSFALIASPTTTSYADTGLTPGTSYSYRVRAEDAAHNLSPYSSPILTVATPATPPPPTGRTTLATDNFNRADAASLGSLWSGGYSGKDDVGITANQARVTSLNPSDPKSVESYNAVTPGVDQWCQITLGTFTGSEDREVGCALRMAAPPTINWYWCYARKTATNLAARNSAIVSHHPNGDGDANLASDFDTVWGSGDRLRCEAQGTTLRLYRIPAGSTTDTLVLTTTDTEFTSGRAGLLFWMNTGGTPTNATVDDWAMGGFGTAPPAAAVTFDAVSNSATGNRTNAVTWSHTIGSGANRVLAVCTQARDTAAGNVAVTSVTVNGGIALTKARSDVRTDVGVALGTELWYLVNPAVGPNTITVTWAGALASYGVGSATSYAGVHQVTPVDATAGSGGSGTTLSAQITTGTPHALITDCAIGQANGMTVGLGQTTRVNRLTTGTTDAVGVSTVNDKAVAGSETMDWTQVDAQNWVSSAVALRPAP
ncbi:MAG: fibronectin type III domain-containing protein [Nitrospira sp.]|nr:fibronectin type III domain-containing protein [Nitrospira sp.]